MGGISLTRVHCEEIMAKTEKSAEATGVSQVTETKDTVVSTEATKKVKRKFLLKEGKHSVSDEVRVPKGSIIESDDDLVAIHGKEKFERVVD